MSYLTREANSHALAPTIADLPVEQQNVLIDMLAAEPASGRSPSGALLRGRTGRLGGRV